MHYVETKNFVRNALNKVFLFRKVAFLSLWFFCREKEFEGPKERCNMVLL